MENLYRIITLTCMAVIACLAGTNTFAENSSLPDSLLTDDYVYEYTFSDFDKAERIMQELRRRKSLPDFKLDATEGDLYFNTGHYYQALKFYKRALENDSVRLDDNLFRLGRTQEADDYYKRFLSTAKEYERDNYLIMPYLFDRRMYDEVIRMNSAREKILSSQSDTVTYHMTTIKKSLGRAFEEKSDYRTAARYFRELAVLRDSIKNREQKSSALELAALYETHKKDMIIQKQDSDAHIRNLWLGVAASIAVLLGIFLCFDIRYNRKIRFKNNALVKNINELLHYKEEIYQAKDANLALQQQIIQLNDALATLQSKKEEPSLDDAEIRIDANIAEMPEMVERETESTEDENVESEPEECGDAELGTEAGDERYGKELYEQMEHLIISGQLYLDPKFSGEKARKLVGIPRNRFVPFIKRYTGDRFLKYLNRFRLYHAARMLQENPGYGIETVARESGIPALRSFHRLFLEEFSVTPTEYRKKSKRTDN